MQLAGLGSVVASQTMDITVTPYSSGGASLRLTEREFRLAGNREGIDTFASAADAIAAARLLSNGSMPGLAVVRWRSGYRLHDVHTASKTVIASSTHGTFPPFTRILSRSSVPFAAGNIRTEQGTVPRNNPAIVIDDRLVALVDGSRVFMPGASRWSGKARLVEQG